MSSYTGNNKEHIKIVIGDTKLITLLPNHDKYFIQKLMMHSYSYIPSETEWIISPTSSMLYYLRLTEYK
jgi:hypothetical protein